MAKKKVNPIEQHVEKLTLGISVALLGTVCVLYLPPPTVDAGGQPAGPGEVDERVAEQANALDTQIKTWQPEAGQQPRIPAWSDQLRTIFRTGIEVPEILPEPMQLALVSWRRDPAGVDGTPPPLPMDDQPTSPGVTPPPTGDSTAPPQLARRPKVLAPTDLVATKGYSQVLSTAAPRVAVGSNVPPQQFVPPTVQPEVARPTQGGFDPRANQPGPGSPGFVPPDARVPPVAGAPADGATPAADPGREAHWVTVFGRFDRLQQERLLRQAGFPAEFAQIFFLRVELERQQVIDGSPSGEWQLVPQAATVELIPTPEFPTGPVNPFDRQVLAIIDTRQPNSFINRVLEPAYQADVMQPPFFATVGAGDVWQPPVLDANDAIAAQAAYTPNQPPPQAQPGQPAPPVPGSKPLIYAHDTTVVAGNTYTYRMRVVLYHRLAGLPQRLADQADARLVELAGDWSSPTEPVVIPPDTQWFLSGFGGGTATATVFKVFPGDRVVAERFANLSPGRTIGAPRRVEVLGETREVDFSTGAVILDVRDAVSRRSPRMLPGGSVDIQTTNDAMIVYRGADGMVRERFLQTGDRSNPEYKRLDELARGPRVTPRDPNVAPDGPVRRERERERSPRERTRPTRGERG